MRIAAINAGSTSLKLALVEGERTVSGETIAPAGHDPVDLLRRWFSPYRPAAVAHRVVHDGGRFGRAARIDDSMLTVLEGVNELAPLHNPVALRWIDHARRALPHIPHVAVFDTGLYCDLPLHAQRYAIPETLALAHGVRRYGFHGLAHGDMLHQWQQRRPDLPAGGRLITFQLGGGSSMTAVRDGRPQETSMGFSPLEGLVMATRSGDIDVAAVAHIARRSGLSLGDLETLLNRESGLLGLSGISGDMSRLLHDHSDAAAAAVDVYCHRARKYLGAYLAVLGGADGIVFGGGIGENAPVIRTRILQGMEWAGIHLDHVANESARGTEHRISSDASAVEVRVLPVDEARVMAREVHAIGIA